MTATTALLGLLAQTSIHAGAGSQTGIIDLPIQREGHNGYPCVFGSAVKGALRDKAEQGIMAKQEGEKPKDAKSYAEKIQTDAAIVSVYGTPPKQAGDSAGAIIVTDARLLLFPVRSLTSQFKWVTCPDALRRYLADCERLLGKDKVTFSVPSCEGESQAIIHNDNPSENDNTVSLFLEEYRFEAEKKNLSKSSEENVGSLITALAQLMQRDDAKQALEKQLVIVSDDSFAHLVNHATPVNAHNVLNSLTKTSDNLWYEETLPPETLLYIGLSANASRQKDNTQSAQAILKLDLELFKNPYLQLGGNETVGMGWCIVKALESK